MITIFGKHRLINGSSQERSISVHKRLRRRSRNLCVSSNRWDWLWDIHLINNDIWLDHLIYHIISNLNNNMCRICLDCCVMNTLNMHLLSINNLTIISGLLVWSRRSVLDATGYAKLSNPTISDVNRLESLIQFVVGKTQPQQSKPRLSLYLWPCLQ